jgi:tetratricopeptide (TPR) repeat protein
MKKMLSVLLGVVLCASAFPQVNKNVPVTAKSNPHLKVYDMALVTGDVNTAITALNYYITEQGSNNPYADTLAMLYMQQGSFPQCYYWADKRLAARPDDNGLLEMKGICLEKLQQPKEAIVAFEKLYAKTKSPYHAYKLMELQYSIKRLAECIATANSAEQLQYKPEYTMTYNVGDQVGRTYLQAGVFNIHGLALYDLDRKAEGRAYFEKAVALDSNFVLARQNLEAIKTIEGNGNKVNTTPNQPTSPANKQKN